MGTNFVIYSNEKVVNYINLLSRKLISCFMLSTLSSCSSIFCKAWLNMS